uniref:Gypsy retrotransposon integrase-like protein 1 n=1 Tax=Salarias fasciatus TaxID=181472 RepID=A0A672HNR1_SALFA
MLMCCAMVVVQKQNGKPRVCIDPKPLNTALKRSHFPLPTIEDILPDLSKAKVFTVCDVKSRFWHVQLEEESSYLTTFATPFGRYRWLRMPMGISPAPEIFQRKLTQALDNVPGLYIIADDILITGQGETQEEAERDHDEKLQQFLDRCRQKNIKLNAEKFRLRQNETTYIGHRLTAEGLKADPEKVRAVEQMPAPTDVKAVQRLIGMVNYLTKFCPHLLDQCKVLRDLTHKDSEWNWMTEHEEAFLKLKETIANAPVLKYYNPDEELTVQCDASDTGLGAALMQMGKPVAFASRALTQTERGYAQIEKEFLAMVFSMEKFHQYTYGRKVTVQSDHKPLETIVRQPLLSAPKRLQGMMLRIQKYDINVTYVPGRDMLLADTLSRVYLPETTPVEAELETVNMVQHLPISAGRLQDIRSATEHDKTLQLLIKTMSQGWPKDKSHISSEISPYFSFQGELSHQDGLVFRGERAVIPDALRTDITVRLHSSHLGVEGCLRRARECVYWLGMNDQIKKYIAKCDICRSMDMKQQKETLISHEVPSRPWAKVGTDLFVFDNKDYLITVDYFSNFWEIDYLADTKSTTVIKKLKSHFARQGIPDTVISDNGPQYASQEFQKFSKLWGFQHVTSSPGYPQSNGKAESAVKTAKRLAQSQSSGAGSLSCSS